MTTDQEVLDKLKALLDRKLKNIKLERSNNNDDYESDNKEDRYSENLYE